MLTAKEAAELLDGVEYREWDKLKELFKRMADARLVAVFGASDDLMEWRGAIDEEFGLSRVHITNEDEVAVSDCEQGDDCPYFKASLTDLRYVEPVDDDEHDEDLLFLYRTNVPHETFRVMEDDSVYCRGIVFSLDSRGRV